MVVALRRYCSYDPRHRRQRQQDRALITLASKSRGQASHHGSGMAPRHKLWKFRGKDSAGKLCGYMVRLGSFPAACEHQPPSHVSSSAQSMRSPPMTMVLLGTNCPKEMPKSRSAVPPKPNARRLPSCFRLKLRRPSCVNRAQRSDWPSFWTEPLAISWIADQWRGRKVG